MLRREGVVDAKAEELTRRATLPLEAELQAYANKLTAADRKPKHITTTTGYIRTMADACGFATLGDITPDPVNRYAAELRESGRSARTVHAHLTAMKSFTRWLARHGKLPADPLASVSKPNPKADRRRERRPLLPDEWPWLRDAATHGRDRGGMSGPERALLYELALQTGLRAGELRSLTRGRLHLEGTTPCVTCRANSTKNAKPPRQHVTPDLADRLRDHARGKLTGARLFDMPPETDTADMLRADLADARTAYIDATHHDPQQQQQQRREDDFLHERNHDGEVLDFHALRHTCGAWLAMRGVHPKAVQAVMRHSTITLTMDTYGHLFPGTEADAVARLADVLTPPTDNAATGTADAHPRNRPPYQPQHWPQQSRRKPAQADATRRSDNRPPAEADDAAKPLRLAAYRDSVRNDAKRSGNASCRTRTYNPLIKSQLL